MTEAASGAEAVSSAMAAVGSIACMVPGIGWNTRHSKSPTVRAVAEVKTIGVSTPVTVVIGYDLDFPEFLPKLFPHNPTAKFWFEDRVAREQVALRTSSLQ